MLESKKLLKNKSQGNWPPVVFFIATAEKLGYQIAFSSEGAGLTALKSVIIKKKIPNFTVLAKKNKFDISKQ